METPKTIANAISAREAHILKLADQFQVPVVTHPMVSLLAHTVVVEDPSDVVSEHFGASMEPPDDHYKEPSYVSELAGRVCYMSYGRGRKTHSEYLTNIIEQAHGSVLEHANLTFLVSGVSRNLTHELVRHRAGFAYSQESTRYVDKSNARFVVPPKFLEAGDITPEHTKAVEAFLMTCRTSLEGYRTILTNLLGADSAASDRAGTGTLKECRETAREVLCGAVETSIVVTCNLRALRWLLELRGSAGAASEFRRLSLALYGCAATVCPTALRDLEVSTPESGPATLRSLHSKV